MSSLKIPEQTPSSPVFKWRWNVGILIFAGIFLPLTLTLGVWQLHRADQKREMLAEHEQRRQADPVALATLQPEDDHQYRRVKVSGQPDGERYFLLDNRTRNGRSGYEVLWPVKTAVGKWVLVNRGWIAGGLDRRELPQVPGFDAPEFTASGANEYLLEGYLYRSKGKALVLGQEEIVNGWPQVIQQVDMELLESRFGAALFPYVLRQEASRQAMWKEPRQVTQQRTSQKVPSNELKTGWIIVNVLPEKHTAYAVQWFSMALALLILTLVSNSNLHECLQYRRGATKSDG